MIKWKYQKLSSVDKLFNQLCVNRDFWTHWYHKNHIKYSYIQHANLKQFIQQFYHDQLKMEYEINKIIEEEKIRREKDRRMVKEIINIWSYILR